MRLCSRACGMLNLPQHRQGPNRGTLVSVEMVPVIERCSGGKAAASTMVDCCRHRCR